MENTDDPQEYDVFLSYNSEDIAVAERVYDRLVAAGFSVWFDRTRLQPGFNWYESIKSNCERSRVIVPVLTPHWKQSKWTKFETYARDLVVPLLCEGEFIVNDSAGQTDWTASVATPPVVRFQAQVIDTRDTTSEPWERLFHALRPLLDQPSPVRQREGERLDHPPPSIFVGREDKLNEIHEKLFQTPTAELTQGRIQVVSGIGGIGKTTLVRAYTEEFWRLYSGMFWVDCRQDLTTQFARIYNTLFPDEAERAQDDAYKAAKALHELNQTRPARRLLILDDAENYDVIKTWLPDTGNCHTIITTRYALWPKSMTRSKVNVLEPEPSRELLLKRSDRIWSELSVEERESCDALASQLGYLPLALEQAAAYIHAQQDELFGFNEYLPLYKQAEAYYLQQHVSTGETDYPKSVFATWRTTIEKLSPESQAMLRLAGFMADTPIPNDVFVKAADIVQDLAELIPAQSKAPPAKTDEATLPATVQFREWRGALLSYSMITASSDGAFSVHGLVQSVERHAMSTDQRPRWIEKAMTCLTRIRWSDLELEEWDLWFQLLPHAESLCGRAAEDTRVEQNTKLLIDLGSVLNNRGNYAAAIKWTRKAYEVRRAENGEESPETLAAAHNLGTLLNYNGQYAESESILRDVLDVRERLLGGEHTDTLVTIANLAGSLRDKGEYAEAETLFRRALQAQEHVLGAEHLMTLGSVNNLAGLLKDKCEYAEAEALYHRALESLERRLGAEHPHTLRCINNLANLLRIQDVYVEAEELFRRAMDGLEQALGAEHPDTLASVSNLAMVQEELGEYAEAEQLYRRALKSLEYGLGAEHPNTLVIKSNLASFLIVKGEHAEAEALFRRVLEAKERVLGTEHPSTLIGANRLASLLDNRGEPDEAETLYRRVLQGRERVLGADHPDTMSSINKLAVLLAKKGEHSEADGLLRRVVRGRERVLGAEHPDTLASITSLVGVLTEKGEYAEAESLCRRNMDAQERVLGAEHQDTLISVINLACLLRDKGEYAEAEALYRRAVEAKEGGELADHPQFALEMNNYALLLRKLGRYKEAATRLERAIELEDRILPVEHPKRAHRRNNLAMVLMLDGQFDEAIRLNAETWKLKANVSEGGHDLTSGRILFIRIALSYLTGLDASIHIGQLRTLFQRPDLPCLGDINRRWQAADILDSLRQQLSPEEADLMAALVEVLNDQAKLPELDRFTAWTSQEAVSLDVPWPTP